MRLVKAHSGLIDADRVVGVRAEAHGDLGRPAFSPDGAEVRLAVRFAAIAQIAGERDGHMIALSSPFEINVCATRHGSEPLHDFVPRFVRLVDAARTEGAEAQRAIDDVLAKAKAILEGEA